MKISVFVGTSVDGFIARPDDTLDFLSVRGAGPNGYEEFVATVDVHVIGRRTFETVLGFDAWPYGKKPVIVLTNHPRTLKPPKGANCEAMAGSPGQIVTRLAKRGFRHIYVDGGKTIQKFLRAGLVQRLVVTRVPVLIGDGIPLFGDLERDVRLKHVTTRVIRGGLVQTEYRVLPS